MSTTSPLDGLRFAFGTLTALPVRVTRWDREAARGGMLSAPVVGLVVGGCAAGLGLLLLYLGASPLLAAVASAAVPAVLTRGLHLDGLADTADGLGSGKPAEDALRIMKQSDIGPFGVLALVLVLLAQAAALTQLYDTSWALGAVAAVVSAATARLALTLAARAGVPAARPEGLGAAVAGVVPVRGAVLTVVAVTLAAAAVGAWCGPYGGGVVVLIGPVEPGAPFEPYDAVRPALAVLAALAAAELLLRHCTRRFGGVTGDVFGGLAETAATTALVVFCLGR
ncbi:adenosylcobinamide-GDP ribazoletransferase [Streptomyces sp. NBC_00103]|uniref:adenosylcobinamide-GDP ribazoletransferase n=1 Tax=Streptomyces sp. NBC_00103 TaxID=2975653 RepID=UPI002253BA4F|nr:adenosylcobinamide-GDP ribazoletransferase [Streptomyces sp. NBC_00103]MCX5370458.1 adenosylcobinamide-GDP ribazoletransferase [Streptomyces sp. NBC_00103]